MDQMKMYMSMFNQDHSLSRYQNSTSEYVINHQNGLLSDQVDENLIQSKSKVKICKVCGDLSKSNHFGALSCCSCKAFFRRSVQNESYKNFHCPYNNNCEITILSRKCCQFCRFEKCVRIGMEKSWVMSEEERLQLLKNRLIKKQKKEQDHSQRSNDISFPKDSIESSSNQNSDCSNSTDSIYLTYPDYSSINDYLTNDEINQIEVLVNDYLIGCVQIQPKFISTQHTEAETNEDIIQLFLNCVYQFSNFAKKLEFFKDLKLKDQQVLLRSSIIELCFLRAAYLLQQDTFYRTILIENYDDECTQNEPYQFSKVPVLRMKKLEHFLGEQLINKFLSFVKQIQECNLDEPITILTVLVVLLNPERNQLTNCKYISSEQEFFLNLLERYMQFKFGSNLSSTLFAKLLMTLPDLRELAELFAEFQLENRVLEQFNPLESDKFNLVFLKNFKSIPRIFKIRNQVD